MRTSAKILLLAVLLCLLLPLTAAHRQRSHGRHQSSHRPIVKVRLRRSGPNHPANRPDRPAPVAMLPPDDDRLRLGHEVAALTHEFDPSEKPRVLAFLPRRSASQSAPDQPLYRTLCILRI